MTPEYIFYGLVIALAVICAKFLVWWARDVSATTAAIDVARRRLADIGIGSTSTANEILDRLVSFESEFEEDEQAAATVVSSLYLLKSELGLGRSFFSALADLPVFRISRGLAGRRLDGEAFGRFLLRGQHIQLKRKPMSKKSAERLEDNLFEFEDEITARDAREKVAA